MIEACFENNTSMKTNEEYFDEKEKKCNSIEQTIFIMTQNLMKHGISKKSFFYEMNINDWIETAHGFRMNTFFETWGTVRNFLKNCFDDFSSNVKKLKFLTRTI